MNTETVLPPCVLPPVGAWLPVWGHQRDGSFVQERDREHWIYFVQGDDGGPVKIGRTRSDPRYRLSAIQNGYPFGQLRFVGLIRGHRSTERELHHRFREARMMGEWFRATPELLAFIRALSPPAMPEVRR